MALGGQLDPSAQAPGVRLLQAYSGIARHETARWIHPRRRDWALDYLHHGRQTQRVGSGRAFVRPSGLAALYAPGCAYHEFQEAGKEVDESYVVFRLEGSARRALDRLTGRHGFCHFEDPDGTVAAALRAIAEEVFARRPGSALAAHGRLEGLLAALLAAEPKGPRRRVARAPGKVPGRGGLRARVEALLRADPGGRWSVAALARRVGMSASAFAHAYPRLAGETPHRAILRLKIEAAKGLLLGERLRVKEAAERLGFSSEFHFSRAFKRLEGVAPRDYRPTLLRLRNAGRGGGG
jgi:AraC-like DNA-binding protein